MKHFTLFILSVLIAVGCTDELKERLENLENRVSQLEEVCNEINSNLSALQAIVTAMQNQISITEVEQLSAGYKIHFSDGTFATIKNGKDSDSVPVFGVRKDTDNIYYWTLDGEWLKDEHGNKVRAQGIIPRLKIENDYWFVSYDNGKTWSQLGNATGEGADCIFKSVTEDDDNVYFTLSDNTVITIPKGAQGGGGQGDTPVLEDVDDVCEMMDDLNFMSYCYENFDVNHDSRVSMAEANAVSIIECNTAKSFKGIEYFTNLEEFNCSGALVDVLDMKYNTKLSRISIENCINLVELIFADDAPLSSVSYSNIGGCKALVTVSLPDNCNIGERAFEQCRNLKKIKFPANLTSIGESAFEYCDGLTEVTFPESLTSIDQRAFYDCDGLTSVTFNSNINCGRYAFGDSPCLFYGYGVTSDNMMYAPNHTIKCVSSLIKNAIIPSDVTSIGSSAFSGCDGLTEVTFPESLTSIGESAFYSCDGLTEVTFPESLTSIEGSAFDSCYGLKSVTFNSNINCNSDAFRGSPCLFYGYGVTSDNMMYAPNHTIKSVSSLIKNAIIPSDVISIEKSAFAECSSLTSVDASQCISLTSIGDSTFYRCTRLKSVILPDSLTSIGRSVFAECSSLTSVDAFQCKNLESIDHWAFELCPIHEFLLGTLNPPSFINSFSGCSSLSVLKVPEESVEAYKNSRWADYFGTIEAS